MERKAVESSQVKAVGYDPATKVLEVEFHSGAIYQYPGAEPDVYEGLMNAESVGRFFNQNVKFSFDYQRMPEDYE